MQNTLTSVTIHVPNVWQTVKWYRQVLSLTAQLLPGGTAARLEVAGRLLIFAAHDAQQEPFGPRRLNSFLSDPPAFHLDVVTADVPALFAHALAHGAVPVAEPAPDPAGYPAASLRDLNGILIRLRSDKLEVDGSA